MAAAELTADGQGSGVTEVAVVIEELGEGEGEDRCGVAEEPSAPWQR
ncbi:hypothetical protein AB0F45_21900 [Streptomyces achromogenes]